MSHLYLWSTEYEPDCIPHIPLLDSILIKKDFHGWGSFTSAILDDWVTCCKFSSILIGSVFLLSVILLSRLSLWYCSPSTWVVNIFLNNIFIITVFINSYFYNYWCNGPLIICNHTYKSRLNVISFVNVSNRSMARPHRRLCGVCAAAHRDQKHGGLRAAPPGEVPTKAERAVNRGLGGPHWAENYVAFPILRTEIFYTAETLYKCVRVYLQIQKKAGLFVGQVVLVWNLFLKCWAFLCDAQAARLSPNGPRICLSSTVGQVDRSTSEL